MARYTLLSDGEGYKTSSLNLQSYRKPAIQATTAVILLIVALGVLWTLDFTSFTGTHGVFGGGGSDVMPEDTQNATLGVGRLAQSDL